MCSLLWEAVARCCNGSCCACYLAPLLPSLLSTSARCSPQQPKLYGMLASLAACLLLVIIVACCACLQEEVLARSQSKQFYQHLLANFQQLKSELASSRPCFLLPRGGSAGSSSSTTIAACSSLLAVTCALDDDLAGADEARQQLQLVHGGPGSTSRHESAPATPAGNGKSSGPGSFNIFNTGGSGSDAGAGKPGLGVFIGGGGAGAAAGTQAAVVLAACPHQVLLPADGPEGEALGRRMLQM